MAKRLNPKGWKLAPAMEWATTFAHEHRIPIFEHGAVVVGLPGSARHGMAFFQSRHIRIPKVVDASGYAVLLHEIGHLVDDQTIQRDRTHPLGVLLSERRAWEWATTTPFWHHEMANTMAEALTSYLESYYGVEVLPPDDDLIWRMVMWSPAQVRKFCRRYPVADAAAVSSSRWEDLP